MPDNPIQMQHSTKGSASFTHGETSIDSDEDGVISVPSHLTVHAKSHGFSAIAEKGPKKLEPLAKTVKAGDGDPDAETDADESKTLKLSQKAAKASGAKGGAE